MPMSCPACGQRKGRRACPALGQTICAVCCGTKRLTEIACPDDCSFLASSRVHPAAVVKRQQEQDAVRLLPTIRHLTERQYQLYFLFCSVIVRHTPDGFARLADEDVAEAADAVAGTLETASRGVIYEQVPASLVAQRLARELQTMLSELRAGGTKVYDLEAAIALRAIAQGGRTGGQDDSGAATSYLTVITRLLNASRGRSRTDGPESAGPGASSQSAGETGGPRP